MESLVNPWDDVKEALGQRIQEIRRSTYLLVEEKSKHLFAKDLAGLDASVRALECQVAELRARLKEENEILPKVEALVKACQLQEADLDTMAVNLPQRLPSHSGHVSHSDRALAGSEDTRGQDDTHAGRQRDTRGAADTRKAAGAANATASGPSAAPVSLKSAPRWYVTEGELNAVASYMRGRLTLDKVNAALEEVAGFSDSNLRLMAQARGPHSAKLTGAERKRASELLHSVALRDGVKGRAWFLESDLKDGVNIKPDKTGRSILTVLRHLGRLHEVRCTVNDASTTVYVLQGQNC